MSQSGSVLHESRREGMMLKFAFIAVVGAAVLTVEMMRQILMSYEGCIDIDF